MRHPIRHPFVTPGLKMGLRRPSDPGNHCFSIPYIFIGPGGGLGLVILYHLGFTLDHFGVILDRLGVIWSLLGIRIILDQLWFNFWLGWGRAGVMHGSIGIILDSFWCLLGVIFGLSWGDFQAKYCPNHGTKNTS